LDSIHVSLRLSRDAWERYSEEAAALGLALGTYLRSRLEHVDRYVENELALRARPVQPASGPGPGTPAPLSQSVQLEMLLVLRQIARPQMVDMARAELKRIGLEPWSSLGPPER
jgi:hypothetical protein